MTVTPGTPALTRLDALAPNSFHLRLAAVLALALFAAAAGGLALLPAVTGAAVALALAAGGLAGGILADRFGRRTAIADGAVLVLAGALAALAAPIASLTATAGLGILVAAAVPHLAESTPPRLRGLAVAILSLGVVLTTAVPNQPAPVAIVAGAAALIALLLWRGTAESPRWLWSRGQAVEADAVVRRAERAGGAPAITLARVAPVPPARAELGALATPGLLPGLALGFASGFLAIAGPATAIAGLLVATLDVTTRVATPVRGAACGIVIACGAAGLWVTTRDPEAVFPAAFVATSVLGIRLLIDVFRGRPLSG